MDDVFIWLLQIINLLFFRYQFGIWSDASLQHLHGRACDQYSAWFGVDVRGPTCPRPCATPTCPCCHSRGSCQAGVGVGVYDAIVSAQMMSIIDGKNSKNRKSALFCFCFDMMRALRRMSGHAHSLHPRKDNSDVIHSCFPPVHIGAHVGDARILR